MSREGFRFISDHGLAFLTLFALGVSVRIALEVRSAGRTNASAEASAAPVELLPERSEPPKAAPPEPEPLEGFESKIVRVSSSNTDVAGWIASPSGEVLTRILPSTRVGSPVRVFFPSGEEVAAKVERMSDSQDLSILSCADCAAKGHLETGEASVIRTGSTVYAFGSPAGRHNLSKGRIRHPGRKIDQVVFMECDIPFGPADSGGPLFDDRGRVIGILAANVAQLGGICFALPIEYALQGPGAVLFTTKPPPFTDAMRRLIDEAPVLKVAGRSAEVGFILRIARVSVTRPRMSPEGAPRTIPMTVEWELDLPLNRPYGPTDRFSLEVASLNSSGQVVQLGHVEPSRVRRDEASKSFAYRFAATADVNLMSLYRGSASIRLGGVAVSEPYDISFSGFEE